MKYKIKIEDAFGEYYLHGFYISNGKCYWESSGGRNYDKFTLAQARKIITHKSVRKYGYVFNIESIL